jgi:membrane-associated phospholipid phosphatase
VRGRTGVAFACPHRPPACTVWAEPIGTKPLHRVVSRLSRRSVAAVLAFSAAAALEIYLFGLSLTPDHFLLVSFAAAVVLRRTRAYIRDFLPFLLLIVLYQEARGVAHLLHPSPYYLAQLGLEKLLFWGRIPTVELQHMLWTGQMHLYDRMIVTLTSIHNIVPPGLAFVFWLRNRPLFVRFVKTLLTLSFASALVFLIYPAAPPWAASRAGLIQPVALLTDYQPSGHLSGSPGAVHSLFLHNPYAAIPSLHAGYAFLVFLFVAMVAKRSRWRWPITVAAALYPLAMGFAVVYTGNHYVVDVLIGFAFATAAFFAVPAFALHRPTLKLRIDVVAAVVAIVAAMALAAAAAGSRGPSTLASGLSRSLPPISSTTQTTVPARAPAALAASISHSLPPIPSVGKTSVDLSALMPFPWTRVYVFGRGTRPSQIDRTLGFRWTPAPTEAPRHTSMAILLLFVQGGTVQRQVVREAAYGETDPLFDCIVGKSFSRARARFEVVERVVPAEPSPLIRRALVPIVSSPTRERELKRACLPVTRALFR